jgi:CDP-diacylglycerol--serine O-phosphatidyltransferase
VPAATVFAYPYGFTSHTEALPVIAMVLVPALLMVSTIRFRSFKTFDLQARRSYTVLLLVAVVLALFAAQPDYLFVILAYGYLVSAFVEMAWSRIRRRPPGSGSREEHDAVLPTKDTKLTNG